MKDADKLYPNRLPISKRMVYNAYKKVKLGGKSAGVDGQTHKDYASDLGNNLYKLWNRLSSGSYHPKAIRGKQIPKKNGKTRLLGIPTLDDRIAQTVLKNMTEPKCEKIFIADSYGYRPRKSALDALDTVRKRVLKFPWVLEIDIQKFFDEIDHSIMEKVLDHIGLLNWQKVYIRRWMTSSLIDDQGFSIKRSKGTPQGGVISPLLANLFLHYVFDKWMEKYYPYIKYVRYADDIIVHCKSEAQAHFIKHQISTRMSTCNLQLHPEKTQIVYCQNERGRKAYPKVSFDFLGYTFKPQKMRKKGKPCTGFDLWISTDSSKRIMEELRKLRVKTKRKQSVKEFSSKLNPKLRGWINYFGKFKKSCLMRMFYQVDQLLLRWFKDNFKRLRRGTKRTFRFMETIRRKFPKLFAHWTLKRGGYSYG